MFSVITTQYVLLTICVVFNAVFTGDFQQRYIGCYNDTADRAMDAEFRPFVAGVMTHDVCYQYCYDKQKTYFGIEADDWCACGDNYSKHGRSDKCNHACPGNHSQICGGYWALGVFSVCAKGYYGSQCNTACGQCQDSTAYTHQCFRNGTCPSGCAPGWTGIRCDTDIDECLVNNGNCSQICNNTPGSNRCSCRQGYALAKDEHTCDDVNECAINNGNCSQICTNTPGSYTCSCNSGYKLNSDGRTCDDIDECNAINGSCSHFCINTPGSWICHCPSGYELRDKTSCYDVNECSINNGNCSQKCINTLGGYSCSCKSGYNLNTDGITCYGADNSKLAALVLLVLIIPIVVVVVLVIRRRSKKKGDISFPGATSGESNANIYPEEHQVGDHKQKSVSNGKHQHESIIDIDTSPIYENFHTADTEANTTRVKVTDLPELVSRINKMPHLLQAEFKKMPKESDASCSFGQKPELKQKNRFRNIIPYDKNRTTLSADDGNQLSTYINASFMEGYTREDKFIAAQGPTVATLNDFWRMIWEYNVCVIVMLTKCHEELKKKCEQYWPETCEMEFGSVKVAPISLEERPDRTTRKLRLSKDSEPSRTVTQLQLMDWPDHGVPEHAVSLLALRHAVKRLAKPNHYTLVHCSAGVGRTGTYLAVDYLLNKAAMEHVIDINGYVKELREQRMHSVQTEDQYTFIFKAVLEGLVLGETTLALKDFKGYLGKLQQINPVTKKSFIVTEFQMLLEMAPLPGQSLCSDALDDINKNKNRHPKLVPMNSHRVFIQQKTKGTSNYINAVHVPNFHRNNGFISTQLPLKETLGDFWYMCVDNNCKAIVFLCTSDKNDELSSFLPTPDNSLQFGSTSVRLLPPVATKENENIRLINVVATRSDRQQPENVYENTQATQSDLPAGQVTIVQIILPKNRTEIRKTLSRAHVILSGLTPDTSQADTTDVVVMSRDGVQHCGEFIAVSNLLDMIKSQQEVDVFQTVYHVKKAQPHFFTKITEYEELYKFAEAYADGTSVYCNA